MIYAKIYVERCKNDFFLRHELIFGVIYFIVSFVMVSEAARMWSYAGLNSPSLLYIILILLPLLCAVIIPFLIRVDLKYRGLIIGVIVLIVFLTTAFCLKSITNSKVGVLVVGKPIPDEKIEGFMKSASFQVCYDPDKLTFFFDKKSISFDSLKQKVDRLISEGNN
ncbi:MAG: hypothetical protein PHO37_18890 [Kiritimatiellae bacterium]|nr:hypothetical protein [Kiritimatiellia bacterium]